MMDTYRPSGRFAASALFIVPPAIIVAVGAAWIYQLLVDWVPLIYLNAVATFGLGVVLGYLAAQIIQRGHCRNMAIGVCIALTLALSALAAGHYFSYVRLTDEWAADPQTQKEAPGVKGADIRREVSLLDFMQQKAEVGWALGSHGRDGGPAISGIGVYAVWCVEAGIVIFFALNLARDQVNTPYCEDCGTWVDPNLLTIAFVNPSESDVARIRTAKSPGDLTAIRPSGEGLAGVTVNYSLSGCPTCDKAAYLNVSCETQTRDKKGKVEKKTTGIWANLLLTADELVSLHAMSHAEPSADAAAAQDSAADALTDLSTGSDPAADPA
ncbi:MAG: hypothetical protein GC162_13205 [Planctomycetes bacterium]|nr:hypothetical protein [Planctomycetota bacterium]